VILPAKVVYDGRVVGFTSWHTVSDTMGDVIFDSLDDLRSYFGPVRQERKMACDCGHGSEWVSVFVDDDEKGMWWKACLTCRVLLHRPHDGYDYLSWPDEPSKEPK